LSAERRWLVACLRALARGEAAPPADEPVDWTTVVAMAEADSVAPALAFIFKASRPPDMPAPVAARLQRALIEATAHQLILSTELGRLLKTFAREGIDVIPLKGPALGETLYRHPALRPCTDLDLLVRRESVTAVDAQLHRLGYRRFVDAHSFAFDLEYDRATVYETTSGVRVDLHWGLLSDPRYAWNEREAEGLWSRAVDIRVAGEAARGLSPEDLLLYLTVHAAVHHALAGLLWLYDLHLVLESWADRLDWTVLEERASRWRVRSALYFALREVKEVFGTRVPGASMEALRPGGPRARAVGRLLRSRSPSQRHALEHLIAVLLVDRGRDVVRTLGSALVPPVGWLEARYGGVASSRLGHYVAHARRLGQIAREATHGLGRPRG
jgi:hypothetical protein